MFLMKKSVLPC